MVSDKEGGGKHTAMFLSSASERPLYLSDSDKTKIEFFSPTGWIKWYTIPFTHSNDAYCSSRLWVLEFGLSVCISCVVYLGV